MHIAVSGDKKIEDILEINIMEWIKIEEYNIVGFADVDELIRKSRFDRKEMIIVSHPSAEEVERIKFLFPLSYIVASVDDVKKYEKQELLKSGIYEIIEKNKTKNFEEVLKEITTNIFYRYEKIKEVQVAHNGRVESRD